AEPADGTILRTGSVGFVELPKRHVRIWAPSPFLLRWLLRFHFTFLLCSGAAENAPHSVVPFMTRVLENRSGSARQRNLHGPGLCERFRIVDCKPVLERVRVEPPETLHQRHGWPGTPERVLH